MCGSHLSILCFFFQAEDGIRDLVRSRGLGDVYKRQVPIQAGDDDVLEGMKRGYTREQYRALIGRVREAIPDLSLIHI